MKFNSETGSKAGKISKRGKNSNSEIIRKTLIGKLDIDTLMEEINQLKLDERVTAKIKLLNFMLPKLQSVDLTVQDLSVAEFMALSDTDQDLYLEKIRDE